jgi:hypothetical protein
MYVMEKRATGADRARARIHAPGEACVPEFADGMVRVRTGKIATVRALRARGWTLAEHPLDRPKPAPAPVPVEVQIDDTLDRMGELKAMTVKELRVMARELAIKGRSGMNEDELIAAIVDAEAG